MLVLPSQAPFFLQLPALLCTVLCPLDITSLCMPLRWALYFLAVLFGIPLVDNGYAFSQACSQAWTCDCTSTVVLAQERTGDLVPAATSCSAPRGLTLNLDAGKTELVCALVGTGSSLATEGSVLRISNDVVQCQLRVVPCYKHLGGWVHCDAQPRHTLQDRIASARQT